MESIRTIKSTAVKHINDFSHKPSFGEITLWAKNYYGQCNIRVVHPNIYIASALIYIFTHPITMRGQIRLSFAKCRAVDYVYDINVSV